MKGSSAAWRIEVDTGGEFTDLVAVGPDGEVRLRKVSSTPSQPSEAVFQALERTGLDLGNELDYFALGTTIATNAVIQRSGARTLFVTTAGFEDNLYIQRIDRKGLYDLQWVKACRMRPATTRSGSGSAILSDGTVRTALTGDEVDRVVGLVRKRLEESPGAAVAVSFLFAYVNGSHERRIADALRAADPGRDGVHLERGGAHLAGVRTSLDHGHGCVRQAHRPPVRAGRRGGLGARAVSGWHALMKSNGGQVPVAHAADRPCEMVLSGLAGA